MYHLSQASVPKCWSLEALYRKTHMETQSLLFSMFLKISQVCIVYEEAKQTFNIPSQSRQYSDTLITPPLQFAYVPRILIFTCITTKPRNSSYRGGIFRNVPGTPWKTQRLRFSSGTIKNFVERSSWALL